MYYLYLKTHNKTGLNYLGQTKTNPYTYKGSGTLWSEHLIAHGNDVETLVLHECETKAEIKDLGIFYSNLFDVVSSDTFANLCPEKGGGSIYYPERNDKVSASLKTYWQQNKEKRSEQNKGRTWTLSEEQKRGFSERTKKHGYGFSGAANPKLCAGTKWYNNGTVNKRLGPNDIIPEGFVKGRLHTPWNKKT